MTDDNGILAGRFAPTIRCLVATLPLGRKVLSLGDTVCPKDPSTGQGSNSATKAAAIHQPHRMANGFDGPRDFFPWFADPDGAASYLATSIAA